MARGTPSTDLSGPWSGVYNYPSRPQAEHFEAKLFDAGGAFTGTTHEIARLMQPQPLDLRATLSGSHTAGEVRFVKTYDGSGGLAHSIDYTGSLSADGDEIWGTWVLAWLRGTFLMIRQSPQSERIAEKRLAEVGARTRT